MFAGSHGLARTADRSGTSLLERGNAELEQDLETNPDAHLGRERVQLAVTRALIAQSRGTSEQAVYRALGDGIQASKRDEKSLKGLIGMMAVGGGPDQADLVALVASTLGPRDGNLETMATFRTTNWSQNASRRPSTREATRMRRTHRNSATRSG